LVPRERQAVDGRGFLDLPWDFAMKNISVATIAAPAAIDPTIGPLTLEHRQEFALARQRAKTIRKAAAIASFNAWATALVAALSVPFAFFSWSGLVTTVALCLVAGNEFRGRRRLLQFEPSAAAILGWNQLGLLALIVAYCVWSMYTSLHGAGSVTAQLEAFSDVDSALGALDGVDALVQHLVVVLYGSVIVLSIVCQGLNALYYFTRRKYVETYVAETPAWIRELQRSTLSA
jgi:hypothetical protein